MSFTTINKKHYQSDIPGLSEIKKNENAIVIKGEQYTSENCISNLRELSEKNPDRRITRDFFRNNSRIPEIAWTYYFGTFSQFLKHANLDYTKYERRVQNSIARQADLDKLRPLNEERLNYGNKYDRDTSTRWKTIIAGSDFHDIECDPFFLRVFVETCRMVQPDVVCIAGDMFDLPEFGKYHVDMREWDVVGRIQYGHDIFRRIRESTPNSQIDLIEGNHEARLLKHLTESSSSMLALLSDLHGFDISKLLMLDEFEINYYAKGDLCTFTESQIRKETEKNYKIYWNSMIAHHFPTGKKLGLSGFHGHHHTHEVTSCYNVKSGSYEWHQLGAGHKREASFTDGSRWNNGFIIANIDTLYGHVKFDYVDVGSTFAVAGGTWYYRQENEFYPALDRELEIHFKE